MNLKQIETGLIAVLGLPLLFRYGILPGDSTPYWLFTLIFLLAFGNILLSYIGKPVKYLSVFLLVLIITLVMWSQIANRGRVAPGQNMGTHDIVLQVEAALRYLSAGKNPYSETYFGTPMEQWKYDENLKTSVNPALYHFVMPPWYLLFQYPFYFVSMRTLGYYDARMPLLFCVLGTIAVLYFQFKNKILGTMTAMFLILAPGAVDYLIEGRSDMFALFWLLLAVYLLERNKLIWAFGVFGLAVLSKQTVWFSVPLFFGYTWLRYRKITGLTVIIAVVAVLTMPFLFWNVRAFLDSTVFYLSGNTAHGYPVSGYGLGMLLHSLGIIRGIHDYYPFIVWQLGLGIPALVFGLKNIRKRISDFYIVYAMVLFVFWYTSRYFNNSHVLFITGVSFLAIMKRYDEEG